MCLLESKACISGKHSGLEVCNGAPTKVYIVFLCGILHCGTFCLYLFYVIICDFISSPAKCKIIKLQILDYPRIKDNCHTSVQINFFVGCKYLLPGIKGSSRT